jgi:hypothetical protein
MKRESASTLSAISCAVAVLTARNATSNLSLFRFDYVYLIRGLFGKELVLPGRMHAANLFRADARLLERS